METKGCWYSEAEIGLWFKPFTAIVYPAISMALIKPTYTRSTASNRMLHRINRASAPDLISSFSSFH